MSIHADQFERVCQLISTAGIPLNLVESFPQPCEIPNARGGLSPSNSLETQGNTRDSRGNTPQPLEVATSVPAEWKVLLVGRDGTGRAADSLLEHRIALVPTIPWDKRLVTVLSSRLGRSLENRRAWFRALRAVCAKAATSDHVLLSVSGTAAQPYVRRAAELFDSQTIELQVAENDSNLAEWWKRVTKQLPPITRRGRESPRSDSDVATTVPEPHSVGFLSPPVDPCQVVNGSRLPLSDRAAVTLSQEVVALHVRKSGNIHALLDAVLERAPAHRQVRLAIGDCLVKPRLRDDLMARGAVGWALIESDTAKSDSSNVESTEKAERAEKEAEKGGAPGSVMYRRSVDLRDFVDAGCWNFLTHCTRRTDGPWPGQSADGYLDDLILDDPQADHSPVATLARILSSRTILASSRGIRGGFSVVCLTAVPLEELQDLRVFRPHRGRWDFEPYGICIRQDRLAAVGARPVTYADAEAWDSLTEKDRAFFQLEQSVTRTGRAWNWTVEQEWRIAGDIRLNDFDVKDVFAFAATPAQARRLQPLCDFPVIALNR